MLYENDVFLSELTKLFALSKNGSSLFITMKRYDGKTKPIPRDSSKGEQPSGEHSCLVRATLGNKKISTIVHQKDLNKFQQAYANVFKGNIDGLKKRDKKTALKSCEKTKSY